MSASTQWDQKRGQPWAKKWNCEFKNLNLIKFSVSEVSSNIYFPLSFFSAKRSLNLIKPGEADLTKPQTRKSLKNSDLQTFPILC